MLRGDPHRVAAVADTLPFEPKYTPGVIAWVPEDLPTDEQIGAALDAFEICKRRVRWLESRMWTPPGGQRDSGTRWLAIWSGNCRMFGLFVRLLFAADPWVSAESRLAGSSRPSASDTCLTTESRALMIPGVRCPARSTGRPDRFESNPTLNSLDDTDDHDNPA